MTLPAPFNVEAADALNEYLEDCRELAEKNGENPLGVINHRSVYIQQMLQAFNIKKHTKFNGEPVAFTLPWLNPTVCAQLCTMVPREDYATNDEEDVDARIPERTLADHHEDVHAQLAEAFFGDIEPIIQCLYGQEIDSIESIQLAVYEATGGVSKGTLHTDEDSDITVTVALNDDYEGGGLHVLSGGVYGETIHIPKQLAGTATIFKGRTTVHSGLPVTEGTRHLLVFWCKV